MTRWTFTAGDILDQPAEVLVCSANVFLNLSGGVGGAILLRYGEAMQRELHGVLAARGRRFVERGEVIQTGPCGTPYRAVLHAVAVDGMYDSSVEVVRAVVRRSLDRAAELQARRVALTALATGYGKVTLDEFAAAIGPLRAVGFGAVEEVVVCVRHAAERDELVAALPRSAR